MWKIREKGAAAGVGVLATYTWDPLSRQQSIAWGNGTTTGAQYDLASRLIGFNHDLLGTAQDVSWILGYTNANQLLTRATSNIAYWWAPTVASQAYVPDGLNRYASVAGTTFSYSQDRRAGRVHCRRSRAQHAAYAAIA